MEESFAASRKDPEYENAYNVLQDEFTRPAAIIEARPARANWVHWGAENRRAE